MRLLSITVRGRSCRRVRRPSRRSGLVDLLPVRRGDRCASPARWLDGFGLHLRPGVPEYRVILQILIAAIGAQSDHRSCDIEWRPFDARRHPVPVRLDLDPGLTGLWAWLPARAFAAIHGGLLSRREQPFLFLEQIGEKFFAAFHGYAPASFVRRISAR
ncbi:MULTISPECIES: hypothetical protein [unclassified Acidithiobacillus]|uniref:hypothetical protein n=1 Tax=unclassified Acidithiobacillus TaxID=2614800 RepID=UPI001D0D5DED|nr:MULTISPECIES: hypothetical protein [unclassified Acidithiobacillus]